LRKITSSSKRILAFVKRPGEDVMKQKGNLIRNSDRI